MAPLHADQTDKRLPELFKQLQNAANPMEASVAQARIWAIWMESNNATIDEWMRKGIEAMNNGQHAEALSYFNRVVQKKPQFAEAWNKRALLYYMMGDYARSMADIEHTLELEPRHFGAISGIGLIEVAKGNDSAAIKAFERVLHLAPQNAHAKDNLDYLKKHLSDNQI